MKINYEMYMFRKVIEQLGAYLCEDRNVYTFYWKQRKNLQIN